MKEDAANGEASKDRHVAIVKLAHTAIHWTMVSLDTKVCRDHQPRKVHPCKSLCTPLRQADTASTELRERGAKSETEYFRT